MRYAVLAYNHEMLHSLKDLENQFEKSETIMHKLKSINTRGNICTNICMNIDQHNISPFNKQQFPVVISHEYRTGTLVCITFLPILIISTCAFASISILYLYFQLYLYPSLYLCFHPYYVHPYPYLYAYTSTSTSTVYCISCAIPILLLYHYSTTSISMVLLLPLVILFLFPLLHGLFHLFY